MKDEDIIFCMLSVGKRYTQDYTCKLVNDILTNTRSRVAITTDFPEIIKDKFPRERRILIDFFDRSLYKLRLPIGNSSGLATDFNFNVRYTALKQCLHVPEKIVIFTDCDNSLPFWEEELVTTRLSEKMDQGFDFFGPRANWKLKEAIDQYLLERTPENPNASMIWHKIWAFDLIDNPKPEWDDAPLPAEFFFVLVNHQDKLTKFYEGWKYMHDWLANLPYTEGTWAECVEIGIASKIAGYNAYDTGWHLDVVNHAVVASGHKVGHPTSGLDDEN